MDSDAQAANVLAFSPPKIRDEILMATYIAWKEEECSECHKNGANSLKGRSFSQILSQTLPLDKTYVDDECPAPTCTTFGAVKSRGEGTLGGARQHSSSWLSDVVKTHAQANFMREVPLADNRVVCRPGRTLEKAYKEPKPIYLVRCLCDGQTTCEDSPEQLAAFSTTIL